MGMRFRKTASAEASLDMTPMIDMTFNLIAFFMFVLNFENVNADERVRLPVADLARPVRTPPEEPLYLNVDRDGRLLAVGRVFDLEKDAGAFAGYLDREAQLAQINMQAAGRKDTKELWTTVLVRADRETAYGKIQRLIEACQARGFVKFALRAKGREE